MYVLSVNANNRLSKFINDIPVEYDVPRQEWARHGTDGDFTTALSKLPENSTRTVTKYLLIEASETYDVTSLTCSTRKSGFRFWKSTNPSFVMCTCRHRVRGNVATHGASSRRSSPQFPSVSLIMGDFNLAAMNDGWYGHQHSPWTKKYERETFESLCEKYQLVDLGAEVRWNATFKRMNNGKMTAFRCDLALGGSRPMDVVGICP